MTTDVPDSPDLPDRAGSPAQLDFATFVDFALDRTSTMVDDLDADAARLVMMLHRATSAIVYDLESGVHRPRGFTWAGFRLLFALWVSGPLDAKDAARLAGMSRQATSAQANTLERAGLLQRGRTDSDGRAVRLSLTAQGEQRIAEAYREHNAREHDWAETLSATERVALVRALGALLGRTELGGVRLRE